MTNTLKKFFINSFVYLIIGSFFLFNGCASYKAEPLEDYTETNSSQHNK